MSQKFLLTFNLDNEVEEQVTKTETIDGKKVEITTKEKVVKPFEFGLLKNSRRLTEQADIFYAQTVGFYTSKGLLSVHQVNKRYYNDDGPFNKDEAKYIDGLTDQKAKLAEEYFTLSQEKEKNDEQQEREKAILAQIIEIQKQIDSVSTPYVGIFNQTAEYKARNKLVSFWTIFLLHKKDSEGNWSRVFDVKDATDFEDGENQLFDIEDGEDDFLKEAIKKAMYYVSYWSGGGDITTEASLKNAEKAYVLEFGDYLGRTFEDLFPNEKGEKDGTGENDDAVRPQAGPQDEEGASVDSEQPENDSNESQSA